MAERSKLPRPVPKREYKPRIPPGPKFPSGKILHNVRGVLKKYPQGITLRQLGRLADVEWETATKYVDYLEKEKEATTQWVGRAKLVRPKPQEEEKPQKEGKPQKAQ